MFPRGLPADYAVRIDVCLGLEFGDKLDTFALPLDRPATQGKVFYEIQLEQVRSCFTAVILRDSHGLKRLAAFIFSCFADGQDSRPANRMGCTGIPSPG